MDTGSISPGHPTRRTWSYVYFVAGCILLILAYLIGITDNPPGIVAMLGGMLALVLAIAFLVGTKGTRTPGQQLLYWAPRGLCIVFALFSVVFALDVFKQGQNIGDILLALLMHLIPTFLIVLVLVIAWRWEWVGGVFFIGLAAVYAVWAWGKPFGHMAIPLISGILVVIGGLFLLNWFYRGALRGRST